ncbi:hypothetical protein COL5a_006467 [Colletotrichum fioriniae]|uniref:uncharacterized protein n=1 Tax=Colletotrichum fioriniae TaxID=710243 RepID=UPI002301B843|nr:uncharacterized protein COL516b_003263 [Colletotrichum fioriniae]KAJ0308718.1 hypothetical protein COL516b_003263 [Colletotrichum fioriniae]KAJ0326912.1 hypothetical protein COL5a_006467 [Colletotrichum fioriniae]KAJ3940597.1 hypothetical protein N0V96_009602 [Colletotrichum fioriniae]
MAFRGTINPRPVIREEEDWEDASSSSDDDYDEDEDEDDNLDPPEDILLPHERARPPSPPAHSARLRLIYHSRAWEMQVYMLKDGKALKERSSYQKLSKGFFAADEFATLLSHWSNALHEQVQEILGDDHPYLSRLVLPAAPRQFKLIKGMDGSSHLPDQLIEPFPEMQGRLVMQRMRPIKPTIIRIIIDHTVGRDFQKEALMMPENYNLHPKIWLGLTQPPEVREMLKEHPNLATRPAYLDQLLKFIGRPGVLELARKMGTALAIIHHDLQKDARNVKFRLAYDPMQDKPQLWENERFFPRPGVGPGIFDAFWAAYLIVSEAIIQWKEDIAPEGSYRDQELRKLLMKVLVARLKTL